MWKFTVGALLVIAALWGGSFALHFLPEYLCFAAFATSWLTGILGVILMDPK